MPKKVNPRRVPMTNADVKRSRQDGMQFGVEFGINCVLFILKDKHDAPDEDVVQLRDEFMYLMDSIAKGYVSYADIKTALKGEYDLTVEMVNGGVK